MFKKSVFTEAQLDAIKAIATEAAVAAVREVLTAQMPKVPLPKKPRGAKAQAAEALEAQMLEDKKAAREQMSKPKVEFILDGKTVAATGWLPHTVYVWNKAKAEELGGMAQQDSAACTFAFVTAAQAKKFAKVASYTIPEDDYKSIVSERKAKSEQYKATKEANSVSNKALAAQLRAKGLTPNGDVWKLAKEKGVAAAVKKYGNK